MKVYKVKVKYQGHDGYGYGLKRSATRMYKFESLEEAKSFVPSPIEVVEGHGVFSILNPVGTEMFEVETIKKKL